MSLHILYAFFVPVLEQDQKEKKSWVKSSFGYIFHKFLPVSTTLWEEFWHRLKQKYILFICCPGFENCASMKNRRGLHVLQKNFELLYHYSMVCLLYY